MAARWNWWLSHAMATRTLTSRSSKREVAFFIDDTLDSGCWNDRCVRRDLECRESARTSFQGRRLHWGQIPAGEFRQHLAQTFPRHVCQMHGGGVHVVVQRNRGPHDYIDRKSTR